MVAHRPLPHRITRRCGTEDRTVVGHRQGRIALVFVGIIERKRSCFHLVQSRYLILRQHVAARSFLDHVGRNAHIPAVRTHHRVLDEVHALHIRHPLFRVAWGKTYETVGCRLAVIDIDADTRRGNVAVRHVSHYITAVCRYVCEALLVHIRVGHVQHGQVCQCHNGVCRQVPHRCVFYIVVGCAVARAYCILAVGRYCIHQSAALAAWHGQCRPCAGGFAPVGRRSLVGTHHYGAVVGHVLHVASAVARYLSGGLQLCVCLCLGVNQLCIAAVARLCVCGLCHCPLAVVRQSGGNGIV